jgi:transposase InsO family protein
MCSFLKVTRAGFYPSRRRVPSARSVCDERLGLEIATAFRRSGRLYGSPRLTRQLRSEGVQVGRRRVARLMRRAGLQGRSARTNRRSRVGQRAFFRRYPNTERSVVASRIDQVWVGDVTYIRVAGRWRYLAVVLDKYSRRVLAWSLSKRRDAELTIRAVAYALRRRKPSPGLIFHTDRGIEYAAHDLSRTLQAKGVLQSMNRPHQMNDNAHMESFFHSLKSERLHGMSFDSDTALGRELSSYFRFYNHVRLHSSLGYRTPASFEAISLTTSGVN